MFSVGLTGGIATGKTLVAGIFAERGAELIDADLVARQVVRPGTEGLRRILDAFGPEVIGPAGELDRERLGGIVFADAGKRRLLDSLLHPLIIGGIEDRIGHYRLQGYGGIVVADIPLLFECGLKGRFDETVLVYATARQQAERLACRNGIPAAAARQRMAAQMPIDAKRALADHVIDNTGSLSDLEAQAGRVWSLLEKAAKKNIKTS